MQAVRTAVLCAVLLLSHALASGALAGIESEIQHALRSADLRDTQVSAMVLDLDTGQTLAEIEADRPMIPASNMKLLSTITALDVLGPEFRFQTQLLLADPPSSGLARGGGEPGGATHGRVRPSLIVLGDGDPAFGDPVLLDQHPSELKIDDLLGAWIQAVRNAQVDAVDELIIDDRVFDRTFVHPTWPEEQLIRRWCAPVAGVNFYDNVIDVLPVPANRAGAAPTVRLFPFADFLQTTNRAETGNKDAFWTSRDSGTNDFTFHGTIENEPYQPYQFTIHDPPMFFGRLLKQRLEKAGIRVGSVVRPADDAALPPAQPLHVVRSTLPLVITRTNQDSQNMFAEALLKRSGRELTGRPGSFETGAAAVRAVMRHRLGTDAAALQIADGSGMSRDNRVTARLMARLLASLHDDPDKAEVFRESLAWAGNSDRGNQSGVGTLRRRMGSLPEGVYIFGKSGYLNGVSALSGYLRLPHPDRSAPRFVAFSFLFNGFSAPQSNRDMKRIQEQMLSIIADHLMPADVNA